MAVNPAPKQRRRGAGRPFKPGQSGNPKGKSPGTRHRLTILAEQLLESEGEALVRKTIELALAGDTTALRFCLDRIVAPLRDRPVRFNLPALTAAGDSVAAMGAVATAVADGDLTPGEAGALSSLISAFVRTIEIADLENRMRALEAEKER